MLSNIKIYLFKLKTLFINFSLMVLAIILSIFLLPIGWVYALVTLKLKIDRLNFYILTIAISIDQLGNVMLGPLFNKLMIKKCSKYLFGDEDDTISYVLGVNKLHGNLTFIGKSLAWLLDTIDENHVLKTVEIVKEKRFKYCAEKKERYKLDE